MDDKRENLLDSERSFKREHCNELSLNYMLTSNVETVARDIRR